MRSLAVTLLMLVGPVLAGGCAQMGCAGIPTISYPERDEELRDAFESLPRGGQARVLELYDNGASWTNRWRLIESAEESLDVVYFILSKDPFGLSFLGLLREKAEQGVRIRLLIDSMGVLNLSDPRISADYFAVLDRYPNVEVRVYNPLRAAFARVLEEASLVPLLSQNHDKILLADGERAIIGGRNIADEYFAHPSDDPAVFFDKDVLLDGEKAVTGFRAAFDREWNDQASIPLRGLKVEPVDRTDELVFAYESMADWLRSPTLPSAVLARLEQEAPRPRTEVPRALEKQSKADIDAWLARHPHLKGALRADPPEPAKGEVRVLDSCSRAGCDMNQINDALARLVEAAQEEIIIENPYLVLTDGGLDLLERAAKRGVRIAILTNSPVSSDNALTQAFFLEQYPKLLARVPTLRLFVMGEGHNIHGKLAVFDRKVTVVGSYNLDFMSAAVNSEVVAAVWSEEFAHRSRENVVRKINTGAPHIFEYKVKRDEDGEVVRHPDGHLRGGEPVVEFGAEHHCTPDRWTKLMVLRRLIQVRRGMPDLTPLL